MNKEVEKQKDLLKKYHNDEVGVDSDDITMLELFWLTEGKLDKEQHQVDWADEYN